jgi:ABC-type Fe3+-hydroxamate transport system substrate-binding protein
MPNAKLTVSDQMDREMQVLPQPKRIVSLVPSQTELLYDLGLDAEVLGITKFCIHPENWFRSKTRIGGTKDINIELVKSLEPDLIIANKEENTKEQIEALSAFAPVWVSDIVNYSEAFTMIRSVAQITGRVAHGQQLLAKIEKAFQQMPSHPLHPTAAYLIWKDPYMTIGSDTFIHNILSLAGFQNCFAGSLRYPAITVADLQEKAPEYLFLSSEPYPFKMKHIKALQADLPQTKIHLVNGEMFSWYGSRMQFTPGYIGELLESIV